MSDWRPIETAPKDGRSVLVYADGYDAMGYGVQWIGAACWTTMLLAGEPPHWMGLPPARHETETFPDGTSWQKPIPVTPTHWMPLPEPPK